MKNILFLAIGFVLVAAICVVVLRSNLPTAKFSVRAVGPTGNYCRGRNYLAVEERMPIWKFAITNFGGASASWSAFEKVKLPSGASVELKDWPLHAPEGFIEPGEAIFAEMVVPVDSNAAWCPYIEYQSVPNAQEQKLWNAVGGIPLVRYLLPGNALQRSYGAWYSTTNVATALTESRK